ncbi:Isochorismate hydrolase [Marinospirillum celere]|uniref:Isochorismate hydrolase n=1 Tax=Marinospirillum celere TaxID=1122252 RepID=A0A1I1HFD6_9GAMM|nr:hydrolase [Marinospirillum celere]SFC22425.1 Isochorismate hydrolase [Marinospirillum celere]
MLMQSTRSLLLMIDIQAKLAPYIHQASQVINTSKWLLEIARELDVPIRATEQYPKGIGGTVQPLAELLNQDEILQKMHFSALKEESIKDHLADLGRQQIILIGTEAHVCAFQTAAELLEQGYQVFLVAEGLGSRNPEDKRLALERLQQAGAQIVSKEMVAFEWLEKAGTDTFRKISKGWIK